MLFTKERCEQISCDLSELLEKTSDSYDFDSVPLCTPKSKSLSSLFTHSLFFKERKGYSIKNEQIDILLTKKAICLLNRVEWAVWVGVWGCPGQELGRGVSECGADREVRVWCFEWRVTSYLMQSSRSNELAQVGFRGPVANVTGRLTTGSPIFNRGHGFVSRGTLKIVFTKTSVFRGRWRCLQDDAAFETKQVIEMNMMSQ